jgi:hypothetical protein
VTVGHKFYSYFVSSKKEKQPLSATHPELAKEADSWDPGTITSGSKKKLSWKCAKKHSWDASVSNRALLRSGCPYCTRKIVIKGENDLASEHPELIDECDGWNPTDFFSGSNRKMPWVCKLGHHWEAKIVERALRNSECPFCRNTKILPGFNDLDTLFPDLANEALDWDPKKVNPGSHKKYKWKCKKGHVWTTSPMHRTRLQSGCGVCDNKQIEIGTNDFLSQFPEIAEQANGWNPEEFTAGSHKTMLWKCKLGHTWKASIGDMTSRTQMCPFCSNRKFLSGFNDVATKFPEIAKEASGWDPKQVHSGSRLKKNWKCFQGHSWEATVNSRTLLAAGCPSCAIFGFDPNKKGYLYLLTHEDWKMYQIGISNYPKNRIRNHQKLGWELMEVRGPMEGNLTHQWETAILRMLKASGADLSNVEIAGKYNGYSEAWSKATFEAKSIKELMRLTEEFEEGKKTH